MVGVSETEAVDTFTKEQIREGISAHEKNRLAQRLTLFFSVKVRNFKYVFQK